MLNNTPEWAALAEQATTSNPNIEQLFRQEPNRLDMFTIDTDGVYFDASKSLVSQDTLSLLMSYARAADIEGWREKMFSGEAINISEDRAVLHTALRAPIAERRPEITDSLDKMRSFTQKIHDGTHTGHTGKHIDTIVNIGIGGSDLGPRLVYNALKKQAKLPVHFAANIDGHEIDSILTQCNPETTLFIVASKSFSTIETLTNAKTAKAWLMNALGDESAVAKHFVALSTNQEAVKDFGISPDNMFPFENYVGGRFSLWSAIGLSLCLGLGFDTFEQLLKGAHAADEHFQTAPLTRNIPILMGVLGFWYRTFLDMPAYAVLPYDQRLEYLPLWLQQLDMESNGKSVTRSGEPCAYPTGPIVFGQPGTNGQHAFYQHIHQSPTVTPCEFIGARKPDHSHQDHHTILLSNMIAQGEALMLGQEGEGEPHRHFTGNRPSTTLLLPQLDAYYLGYLLALYEHKIFVQGVLWGINSFDQWGVELGKTLAKDLLDQPNKAHDPSTSALQDKLLK